MWTLFSRMQRCVHVAAMLIAAATCIFAQEAKGRLADRDARLLSRAHANFEAGRLSEALADLDEYLSNATPSKPANAHLLRGVILAYQRQWQHALEAADAALKHDLRLADAFMVRGVANGRLNDFGAALDDLNRAIELNDKNPDFWINRSQVFSRLDRPADALADMRTAFQLDPENAGTAHSLINLLSREKRQTEVLITIAEHLRHAGDSPRLLSTRGGAWQRMRNYEMAIAEVSEAIRLDPENAENFTYRGMYYAIIGELDIALADCARAESLAPKSPLPFLIRGQANLYGARHAEALKSLRQCLALDDDNAMAHYCVAYILAAAPENGLRDGKLAITHANRACTLTKWSDAKSIASLAAAYAETGNYDRALQAVSHAMNVAGQDHDQHQLWEWLELFESRQPARLHTEYRFAEDRADSARQ
jgi:tetratricopeptide (TPR) repeat protein